MSDFLKIELIGQDGSYWCLAGPGAGRQGVTMNPNIQQFYDAPVKTLWVPGPFGQDYVGNRVQRREIVFTVQTYSDDPETWATIDSNWRWAWDYDVESTIKVTTSDGVRWIKVRLLEEPKPYLEKDPFLTGDNPCVMTVAAQFPYWQSDPDVQTWATVSSSESHVFEIENPGDVPVWLKWTLTAPGTWFLPDFSWGNDMYSRGAADLTRVVPLPTLVAGEHVTADSDPRVQTLISVNGLPTQQRWKGNDLLYPVEAGVEAEIPVAISGATGGAAVMLTIPRWYSRPWSRRRAVPVG